MHQIAQELPELDAYFTAWYSVSPLTNAFVKTGFLDKTIIAGEFRRKTEVYFRQHGLQEDYRGQKNKYDIVVTCSDLLYQGNIRRTKVVWVQEGMVDPMTSLARAVQALDLPYYLSFNTALNGSTRHCDKYCAASQGYKNYFTGNGADPNKIVVTGIPNFDNLAKHLVNDFPFKNYVLVATSDIREAFGKDDRTTFLRKCIKIAAGRLLIFKLHPNEHAQRAKREINAVAPGSLIYTEGSANEMVANCDVLITQYSSLAFVGLALGKEVHSYFNVETLKSLCPIQNGGESARNIAAVCRALLE